MNDLYKQIWIAFKIWLVTVATDTLVGTFFLAFSNDNYTLSDSLNKLVVYAMFSSIFSFPVFLALIFIINRCIAAQVGGRRAYLIVLICGIGLTIMSYLVFLAIMGQDNKLMAVHFLIAVASAIVGISLQSASIRKLADVSADCF